jgi:hypothetical protein
MDKSSKHKEDKEPGFNRLESHRKSLILNASALPPFTKAASSPTEFYKIGKLKKKENFGKIFYSNQKECPKTTEGKMICMKFFLRGVCTKSCNRVHSLSGDDKKKFDAFIKACREKATGDFPQGANFLRLKDLCPLPMFMQSHLHSLQLLAIMRLRGYYSQGAFRVY